MTGRKGRRMELTMKDMNWIIEKLIPKQSITLLHAKGGIGKTWLCLAIIEAITSW